MAYDPKLDERIFLKSWENDTQRLSVSVFSYNSGPKKLQISREIRDNENNFKFAKLGRLNKEEMESLIPFIQEALKQMD